MRNTIIRFMLFAVVLSIASAFAFGTPMDFKLEQKFNAANESPFGLGKAYPFAKASLNNTVPEKFAFSHAKWVTFAGIDWDLLEPVAPAPPSGVKHAYKWDTLDKVIKYWHASNIQIILQINPKCAWAQDGTLAKFPATGELKAALKDAALPVKRMDMFKDLMKNIAERYDNDGNDDMKEQKFPIYAFEICDTPQEPWSFNGAPEEYMKLLEAASAGVKEANENAIVIAPNFTFKGCAHEFKSEEEDVKRIDEFVLKMKTEDQKNIWKHSVAFAKYMADNPRNYDVFGLSAVYGIEEMVEEIAFAKSRMKSAKPIWLTEFSVTYPIDIGAGQAMWSKPHSEGEKFSAALGNLKDPLYTKVKTWNYSEQSKYGFKKAMIALENGVQRIMFGALEDRPEARNRNMANSGLTESKWEKSGECNYGEWRPVILSYKLLNRWTEGYTAMEKADLGKGIRAYKLTVKDGRPVYIAWAEDDKESMPEVRKASRMGEIKTDRATVDAVGIFSDMSQKGPVIDRLGAKGGKVNVPVGDLPVIVVDEYKN